MQATLTWQLSSKYLQFAYEEGGLDGGIQNEMEQENINGHVKKKDNVENQSGGYTDESYQVSRQPIDFRSKSEQMQMLQIITDSKLLLDEVSGACVFTRKQQLPKITVTLLGEGKNDGEGLRKSQKKYVQLHICEKSRHSQYEKYRINKKGIVGKTRVRIVKESPAVFEKIKFNYSSDKAARLIIILYQIGNNNIRNYKSVMVSNQINVLNEHKIMQIDTVDQIKGYFQQEPQHLNLPENKNSLNNKISTQISLQKISDEIRYFETYLTKKSKKNTNLLYIINKYWDILDLFFLSGQKGVSNEERIKQLWRQAAQEIKTGMNAQSDRTCNYLHPQAKFVLKINSPLPSVKIIIRKQFTKLLSIVASASQFDCCEGKWIKLETTASSPVQKLDSIQKPDSNPKPVSSPLPKAPFTVTNHANQPIDITQVNNPVINPTAPPKKHHGKHDDQQFHQDDSEDDQDDDGQYEGQQSQNDSVSNQKRRGRRIGQRKTNNQYKRGHSHLRQNRYSTRNRTKTNDEQQIHSKRAAIQKKAQQKDAMNLRQNSSPQSNLPFKILTPNQVSEMPKNSAGNSQDPSKMGMMNMGGMIVPMMNPNMMGMGIKKPDDKSSSATGMPKSMPMPFMMPMGSTPNPQMLQQMSGASSMPGNIQMVPMGNGMQAVMVPMQMDKNQQGQPNMGMNPMMGGFPMMFGNPNTNNQNSSNTGNSTNNSNAQMSMPQGFMMPYPGMQDGKGNMPGMGQKQDQNKSKPSMGSQTDMSKKEDKKSEGFPPTGAVDMSKFGYMGQMPNMPGMMGMQGMGQSGMQMPQMMMPGSMSGQGTNQMMQMGGMFGMPGMNPMMSGTQGQTQQSQQKQGSQNKDDNKPMQMPMMMQGPGGFPFFMMSGNQQSGQSGQPSQGMNMMGFPGFMPNMQQQNSSQSSQQPGMPQGMMMPMNSETMQQMMRNMNPQQQQQIMMQMKGMMPGMYQMPKNDGNDQNKK